MSPSRDGKAMQASVERWKASRYLDREREGGREKEKTAHALRTHALYSIPWVCE
jgi:flavin-dependent dehydrogenase